MKLFTKFQLGATGVALGLIAVIAISMASPAHAATASNTYCSTDAGVTWAACNPGTVTVTGGPTAANQTAVQAPVAPAAATATKSQLGGCQYNLTPVTFADGQQGRISCGPKGPLQMSLYDANGVIVDLTLPAPVNNVPTAASAQGATSGKSTVLESSHVITGAHNLYWLTTTTDANAGFLMLFDATSAPVDGAVTPAYCVPLAASSGNPISWGNVPFVFVTGITAVYSSTGCLTKTASVHATFYWGAL